MATNQRIFVRAPDPGHIYDDVSDEAISPGQLIEGGGSNDIQLQSTAGENCERAVAMVDRNTHGGRTDDWASGDTVEYAIAQRGDELYMRLGSGSSEYNISKWEFLEADGNGNLQSAGTTGDENDRLFQALEAVDNSGGSSEAFINVRAV